MRSLGSFVSLAAAAAAVAAPLAAQQPSPPRGALSGIVYSAEGRPLIDAEVRAGDRAIARSDADGRWSLGNLPAGRVRLEIRRIGFDRARRTVVIPASGVARLIDTLQYTGVRLEPVVVSGLRQALPGVFERRERGLGQLALAANIEAIPTNLYDLDALLHRLPRLSMGRHQLSPLSCSLNTSPVVVDGRMYVNRVMPLREWIGPYEIAAIEVVRGRAAWQLERDRLAAGGSAGPRIDRRISDCEWVMLIWTKEFVNGRRT